MRDARNAIKRWNCTEKEKIRHLSANADTKRNFQHLKTEEKRKEQVSANGCAELSEKTAKEAAEPLNNAFAAAFAKLDIK